MSEQPKSPLREIIQPFVDLVHAPRALWGINLGYLIEGMIYFGMLNYLVMYFNEYVGLSDIWAGYSALVLTAGITISMFFFGGLADRWGVRIAILAAFCLMVVGRVVLAGAPGAGLSADGPGSVLHLAALGGIVFIVLGYGMYQPAAYAAVRQFTGPKSAAMGFAMLYALMNLGGWLPTFFSPIRNRYGISGAYWVYVFFTVLALASTFLILSRKTAQKATARAKAERDEEKVNASSAEQTKASDGESIGNEAALTKHIAAHIWVMVVALAALAYFTLPAPWSYGLAGILLVATVLLELIPPGRRWITRHPLSNARFFFFIFALIPVQTLFAHNWLTLPMYVERAYRESWPWISRNFEAAVNFNALLIFVLVPIVTALTQHRRIYNMMILGTAIMAAPAYLLALGPRPWTLLGYIIIMTVGEAMWQPRFLQYAAEIAPEGRTGAYMGVAQFPWFLTKMIVPLFSGWFLQNYCPQVGTVRSETMWLIYASIAITSTIMLVLAKGWAGKGFKTKTN
jgi:MFS family permease